jgi:hypothetical protein
MKYADLQEQDRRLVLLKALENAAQYRTNAFLLRRFAESVGHTVGGDRIETDLAWLAEQGLVGLEQAQGVTVATITARGLDVATGRTRVPGVAVPQPGA